MFLPIKYQKFLPVQIEVASGKKCQLFFLTLSNCMFWLWHENLNILVSGLTFLDAYVCFSGCFYMISILPAETWMCFCLSWPFLHFPCLLPFFMFVNCNSNSLILNSLLGMGWLCCSMWWCGLVMSIVLRLYHLCKQQWQTSLPISSLLV